ncbi:hypothetical protein L3X38_042395 [Prunus dulcis]|uniref:Transposable element protein n=1 Tax=Prunus dulcis TaxID=3755 RepID=A0AAD4YL63_PRUDU|nr:hypothetical protein L3X38_042395 [Prunus dulcis]
MHYGGISDEAIRLHLFPFSLKERAKEWLYSLPSASIITWTTLASKFLAKFFPAQKTIHVNKEIMGVQQLDGESFHEYWDRFQRLLAPLSQREPGKLPRQVLPNPNGGHETAKEITLRSGKEVEKVDNKERNSAKIVAAPSPKLTVPSDNSKVKVNELIFPAEFLVLEMEEVPIIGKDLPLILGCPFMRTARTKIDVYDGTLTMAFDEETVEFKVFDALKYPNDDHACFSIDVLEQMAPQIELKPLSENLKYAYLGDEKTLPVIIASNLSAFEEDKLIRVLMEHKLALGWTIADIRGISPTKCVHRILLEEESKPTREEQRRLNPMMKEVVKKEVLKLLNVGIVYPISDSKWVSPIQVVPKKYGITVVKNEDNELVPQRIQTGWRVCIYYRKLNTMTRKDHFPLPFIDQMLERLVGYSHYCILDGYSGYNQIAIALKDQEKTTFTYPFGAFSYRRMPFGLCNAPATFQRS